MDAWGHKSLLLFLSCGTSCHCVRRAKAPIGAPRQRASKQHAGRSGSSFDALAVFQDCWWVSALPAGMFRAGIGCFLVMQGCYGTKTLLLRWLDATS